MPTAQHTVAVTQTIIAVANPQRTVITFANLDNANIIYISDESGVTTVNGYPIFPETYISFLRKDGDEPQKQWYGITAIASTIAVLESFGTITDPVPDPEPSPQEPQHPLDAPIMRRLITGSMA